nr:prepilin peptidase [Galbitalea soli]
MLYLAAVTPVLVEIDLRERRLPNGIVLPGIPVGLVAAGAQGLTTGRLPLAPLLGALVVAGCLLGLVLAGGMGLGDAKLAFVLGLASWSWPVAVLWPLFAFLAGGVVSAVILLRRGRGGSIAFGPYLLGGFWAAAALTVAAALPG